MSHRLLLNPAAQDGLPPTAGTRPDGDGPATPRDYHRRLPGYSPTPLHRSPRLAEQLGVGEVLLKEESSRFGLPSYKILGASWATYRTVLEVLDAPVPAWSALEEFVEHLGAPDGRCLVAATDGNHGRAVARMAAWLGWGATILVPRGTAAARIDGIRSEGAEVEVVDGTYDEAVAASAELADARTLVVSDTAWPGYRDVPGWVIEGYSTIFAEIDEAVAEGGLPDPTAVVIPIGVGSLAAAAVEHYRVGTPRAALVGVEPASAACVMASVAAGAEVEVPGPHGSMMAGLNCGRPSPLAFPRVEAGFEAFVAIDDGWSADATRQLARDGLAVGESAAASLGALLPLSEQQRVAIGLGPDSTLLLVLTEGVTDPENFARIVGDEPAATVGT